MANIVAFNDCSTFGGREYWTELLLDALAQRGHTVSYICREAVAQRVRSPRIHVHEFRLGGDANLPGTLALAARVRRLHADAFFINHFSKVFSAGLAGRLARVPRIVSRVDLSSYRLRKGKYRFAMRKLIDYVSANSDTMRRDLMNDMPEVWPERLFTIYDGVNVPRPAESGVLRRQLGIPQHAFVIGSVARLHWRKQHHLTIRAAAELDGVHCIIAGEGPEMEKLRALTTELRVEDRVSLLGHRTDIGNVLDALDVLVVASDHEGMSNSMLEAMAAGLPVISTPVSGAAEALCAATPAAAGIIVEPAAPAIRDAVALLQQDGNLRRALSEHARDTAASRFGFDRMVEKWEALLVGDASTITREEDFVCG